jgi:hypothetical protein
MTINEIESTLHTLEKRHPNLTEEMLLTLLRSSGWEEKVIQEALVIFKTTRALPDGHQETITPSQQVNNQPEAIKPAINKVNEPQSLVSPIPVQSVPTTTVSPPDNLPLKPFESSDHVWPLSRYNDVFHGDVPPILSRAESKLVEEHKEEHKDEHPPKTIKLKRTGFDGEDEGLIALTGISLFVVLLLLAYMYSNGRL